MISNRNQQTPTALITGGTAGLGFALAGFLVAQGYHLIITGRNAARLETAAARLGDHGGTVTAAPGDIADPGHRRQLLETVRAASRQLHLLINNASALGPLPMPRLADYPLDALRGVFETNTFAPLALVQDLRPYLINGLVINISSDAATGGYEGWGGYGASKAALDLLSFTLANELRDEGISVAAVDPGDMRTQMHQDAFPGEDISDRPLPEATIPFWAWLLGQDPAAVSGQRFQAQSDLWQVPA